MINPDRFRWSDTNKQLMNLISDKNIDRLKLENACELMAYKIYPVYSTYRYLIGDTVPSLHYLSQIIFELVVGEMSDLEDTHGWGGITVESNRWGETDEEDDYFGVSVSFNLGTIHLDDIKR